MKRLRLLLVALAAAGALGICGLYDVPGRPVLADNQIFFFLSQRASEGVPPHVSIADPKTQASVLVNAAAMALGRVAGVAELLSFRLVSVAVVAMAIVFAFLLAGQLVGARREGSGDPDQVDSWTLVAGLFAVAGMFTVDGLFLEGASGGRPHVFVAGFAMVAHYLLARRREVAAGAAAAFAFLCWQPSAVVLGALGLALLLSRERPIRRAFRLTGGALAVALLYESYFVLQGVLAVQLDQEFVLPLGSIHKVTALADSVWFVLTDARPWRTTPRALPAAFLAALAVTWLSALLNPRRALATLRERPGTSAFWIAVHVAFPFTVYEHQAHPDLLLVQPYYAVAVAVVTTGILRSLSRTEVPGRLLRGMAWSVAAVAIAYGLDAARGGARAFGGGGGSLAEQKLAAAALSFYREQYGSVWVLGAVHLLALEGEENWTGIGFFWDDLDRRIDTKTWRPLRDGRMPEVIVTGRGLVPGNAGWRQAEYVEETPVFLRVQRIRVFFRKPDAQFSTLLAKKPASR